MGQYLKTPFGHMKITASYKAPGYLRGYGFQHYGTDLVNTLNEREVHALGDGEVIAAGFDGYSEKDQRLGNVVVIIYRGCITAPGCTSFDVACRMFHFDKVFVKAGQRIHAGDVIGLYGNTGRNSNGAHLHIEFDTDTQYPEYAYGIKAGGRIIKKGCIDSTVNPFSLMFFKKGQLPTYREQDFRDQWVTDMDFKEIPQPTREDYITIIHNLKYEAAADIAAKYDNVNIYKEEKINDT